MKGLLQIVLLLGICVLVTRALSERPGGLGETQRPDKLFKRMVKKLKTEAENVSGNTYDVFKAKRYKSQTVNGVMYYVKVKTGRKKFIHVKIYKPRDSDPKLLKVQEEETKRSPIEYME